MHGIIEKKEVGIAPVSVKTTEQNIVNQESHFSRAYDSKEGYQNCQNLIQPVFDRSCIEVPKVKHLLDSDCSVNRLEDVNRGEKKDAATNLTLEVRRERLLKIEKEIEQRWEKAKKVFVPYGKKSEEEIIEEYNEVHKLRQQLWYHSGDGSAFIPNPDYTRAVIENGNDTTVAKYHAFEYNCIDNSYNASTILLHGHHFIALREPVYQSLNAFFTILVNYEVPLLVCLIPEAEYFKRHKIHYCEDYIINEFDCKVMKPKVMHDGKTEIGQSIDYMHTDKWQENQAIDVRELYNLVQELRARYENISEKSPIAIHCAAGVGRTGTLIAAYVIAFLLDRFDPSQISIEEIVLRLSIQRPFMVQVVQQYILLYEFVAYYLEQKSNSGLKLEIK